MLQTYDCNDVLQIRVGTGPESYEHFTQCESGGGSGYTKTIRTQFIWLQFYSNNKHNAKGFEIVISRIG